MITFITVEHRYWYQTHLNYFHSPSPSFLHSLISWSSSLGSSPAAQQSLHLHKDNQQLPRLPSWPQAVFPLINTAPALRILLSQLDKHPCNIFTHKSWLHLEYFFFMTEAYSCNHWIKTWKHCDPWYTLNHLPSFFHEAALLNIRSFGLG